MAQATTTPETKRTETDGMTLGAYRYRIKNTGFSSQRYGPCEVCRKPVSEVHYQVEEQECAIDGEDPFWTTHDCTNLFGHESCLLNARR